MAENTLDVRLLHAAKTLADWNNVTTIPKLGEVCLEIQGNTPPLKYKIKIGDGSSTYAALPYFGTVVNTSGNASVVVVDTVTDGSVTKKVLKFYKFTLTTSTVNGVTTITPTIGDLILTVQEGAGINFSTNTTDTLVNVELEATTADTAQTIADGGTFTTITKDSNNRATKYTTFTLPSIANNINALDVADNTVITAEWNNTNKQIKFYYVKETDGIIQKGSLAYTINATDIAPLQNITTTDTGNSGLEITTNNNVKDVHHKAVTQNITDNSSVIEEKELNVLTNVEVDSYGHITGYTKDKSTNLVAADIKAPVRQSDDSMWNHRVTGGTINIGEETAKISKLRGNTLVWNQLVDTSTSSVTLVSQHKYYTVVDGTKSIQTGADSAISVTGGTDVVIDLTKMFDAGNEPTTVEEFEAMFPNLYYPYNEGELLSLNPDGVKSIGFNQWDEEWENGKFVLSNGNPTSDNNCIRSKNSIACIPNTTYYFKGATSAVYVIFFGATGSYLGESTRVVFGSDGAFITPSNAYQMKFWRTQSTSYNHDICINLSDPNRNGTYEPYKESTLDLSWIKSIKDNNDNQLFPYGLLSTGAVYDEVGDNYAVKRIGSRNYISTDDEDSTVITDGTTTYYPLAEPVTVYFDKKLMTYPVDDLGTETLLPEGVDSTTGVPLSAPFNGTFEYKSNFKDTVLDIINKVNSYKNPVKSKDNVNQTVGKFATYDTSYTVHSSEYQVKNNPFEGAETAITLPTAEQIIEYVNTQIASSLTYKGVVSGLTGSTSGKIYFSSLYYNNEGVITKTVSGGDLYFLGNLDDSASYMTVTQEDATHYKIASGNYYPGTMFVWNESDASNEHWDAIAGTTTVSDGNPTLWVDDGTSVPYNRTQYTVGSIEGHDLHVTVPEMEEIAGKKAAGQVLVGNGTGENDNTATWRGLKLDETVDNSSIHAKISTLGTGVLERYDNGSGDNHDYQWRLTNFPDNFDANQKLGSFQEVITNGTTVTEVPHIYKSENIELKQVKNLDNDVIGFSTYVPLLSKSNDDAAIGTVLVGNYDINSGTHDALPSWRNLKLDELSCDGTNLVPSLGTGFLKREGSDSWSITNNLLTWKLSPDPFNLTVTDLTTDNTGLLNKIYNYTGVTTIQQLSHTSGSATVIDGFRVNIPLFTVNSATSGKVLMGNHPSLPSWQNVSMENISEILSQTAGNEGYLKRTATNSGTEQEPDWTYGWELDPYGGGSLKPSYADNTAVEASEDRQTAPSAPNAGLREQTGTSTYKHYKVPFSAIENDPSTGNNAVVIILNGNFS